LSRYIPRRYSHCGLVKPSPAQRKIVRCAKQGPEVWSAEVQLQRSSTMNSLFALASSQRLEFAGLAPMALPLSIAVAVHLVLVFLLPVVIFMAIKPYHLAASERASLAAVSGELLQAGLG
jgi:hypothetical protein